MWTSCNQYSASPWFDFHPHYFPSCKLFSRFTVAQYLYKSTEWSITLTLWLTYRCRDSIYPQISTYMHACTHTQAHTRTRTRTHAHTLTCTHTRTCTHIPKHWPTCIIIRMLIKMLGDETEKGELQTKMFLKLHINVSIFPAHMYNLRIFPTLTFRGVGIKNTRLIYQCSHTHQPFY